MTDRYKHTPSSIYTGKMQCACRWVVSVETLSFDSLRRGGHDVARDLRRVLQARTRSVTAHIHVFIPTVMQYKHCWPNSILLQDSGLNPAIAGSVPKLGGSNAMLMVHSRKTTTQELLEW